MGGDLIGLVAVILSLGIPIAGMYTYYRVRKLRSEERMAALARGVAIPVEPELNQGARSRRAGILLVAGAIGFMVTFGVIARVTGEQDTWVVASFAFIPLAVGVGYFVDWALLRREAHAS
jgi:uncharacterized protein DUF6249